MRAPELVFQIVGVAGFGLTASTSRTAGQADNLGHLRPSFAAGGCYGAVLVGLVAVFRSCTAGVVRWSRLARRMSCSEW